MQTVSKLKEDLTAKENIIKNKTDTKVVLLKTELNQSRLDFETKIRAIENEKEKEISRVYVRYAFLCGLNGSIIEMLLALNVCLFFITLG